jgi:uncharacterized tellurite resistance protein B-like protein
MSISNFSNILKIFGGAEPTEEEKQELFKEVTVMTLARATASDTNIKPVEIETVRLIIEKVIGEEVGEAEVRVQANSKLFESEPLEKYLAKAARVLDVKDRITIAEALAEVIVSDARVTSKETRFFNMVADAFQLTPAELAGLIENDLRAEKGRPGAAHVSNAARTAASQWIKVVSNTGTDTLSELSSMPTSVQPRIMQSAPRSTSRAAMAS